MEKAIPPKKQKSKRETYYTKTAPMYTNKPLPALPRPSDSRPSTRDGSPVGKVADAKDLPQPLNLPRRPKTSTGLDVSSSDAVPPPLNVPSSSVESKHSAPQPPPRHPARPQSRVRRTSSARRAATGHRPGQKVAQLMGHNVDIYDDSRDRFRSLSPPAQRPVDSLFEQGTSFLEDEESLASNSPASPFPAHGYEPFAGSEEDDTASAAGSKHDSARFSFSSRPSWSSHSPHLSFDGKALSSRSRDSLTDNEAALDYHRFASELADHESNETRRFSAQSKKEQTKESPSSSSSPSQNKTNNRSSTQSLGMGDLKQQRSALQQNAAPARSPSQKPSPQARMKKTASVSFSSHPWSAEEKKRRQKKASLSAAQRPTNLAPAAEQEPRSVFESDSDDDVGISDSIKGIFKRGTSIHQDAAPVLRPQRNSKDDADKSFLDKAKGWRTEKRSRESKEEPKQPRKPKSNDDLAKWFQDKPTHLILS